MSNIVAIKTGGTNFASVEDCLARINCKLFYAKSIQDILNADKILLPGVGSMISIDIEEYASIIPQLKQPVLGICLGMQMLFEKSEENPNIKTLGILNGVVKKFSSDVIHPHTGWNKLVFQNPQSIFAEIPANYVYFTHSYYTPTVNSTQSYCEYGDYKVSAIVQKNNFYGFQFHPERSGKYGEMLLKQFIQKA